MTKLSRISPLTFMLKIYKKITSEISIQILNMNGTKSKLRYKISSIPSRSVGCRSLEFKQEYLPASCDYHYEYTLTLNKLIKNSQTKILTY